MANVYLIRHGIAADRQLYDRDSDRPLTETGDRKTRQLARRWQEMGLKCDRLLTSPLLRARQTAEILREARISDTIETSPVLAPGGDIDAWIDWWTQWQQAGGGHLALVAHQPDLGRWAEILVWGRSGDKLTVKKAGIIGLTLPASGSPKGSSQLFALIPPKFLL